MRHVPVGWKDQLASLKHVFPQFPTDTRHIWQRPHAEGTSKAASKTTPRSYLGSESTFAGFIAKLDSDPN